MTLIFVTAMVTWCLSLIHFCIPLLLAGAVLVFRACKSERRVVKKLYWEN